MNDNDIKMYNCTELWQRENSLPSIPTFSQSLDNVLGNKGLQLCSVTELLGLPGTGKTQLCLQLCASVQIPSALGGLNAEALFIDTKTNFTLTRFKEILSESLLRCQRLLGVSLAISESEALKKQHYVNAVGLEKFCAFIQRLHAFVDRFPRVKLIVVDSITFPFKEGVSPKQRTGLLFRLMAQLQRVAIDKQIAILVTNEMSTRVGLSGGPTVGSLGDAWAHRCNIRIMLSLTDPLWPNEVMAAVLKSNSVSSRVARFKITEQGIRDIE